MSVEIVRGTSQKPASSGELVRILAQQSDLGGLLYVGYPIISTPDGPHPVDALMVSNRMGIVVFDLIEGTEVEEYGQRQDDLANELEARLKLHRDLMHRRQLRIEIHTVSFAPGLNDPSRIVESGYPLATNEDTLVNALESFRWQESNKSVLKIAQSAIESISAIRKERRRKKTDLKNSRGAKLKKLEDSIATLDPKQSRAVIETVDGVQRIRGLAGSGKTIVLALKAAYLHAQHPDWRIAVTFNTRSLKGLYRRLINYFILETGSEPDWENLRIVNAWGAPGGGERDGIYHEYCLLHDVEYFDFQSARRRFSRGKEFSGVCEYALGQTQKENQTYDAILVDEAQDFSPAFLRLCYRLLKGNKRLVYAYDELQNLSGESVLAPEEIFGTDADGSPRVQFESVTGDESPSDIVLEKCYRNSRPVLVTAHALGFGTYRPARNPSGTGLIQMFDHPQLWEDIGYELKDGTLEEGKSATLQRTEETSPKFLEDHSSIDDLVRFICFESEQKQSEWLVQAIKRNLLHDELRHDDIIVINPDPRTTRDKVGSIRRQMLDEGIKCHLAGVDTHPDIFFRGSDSVTFSGIHRAKGNEAGMVYIVNAQDCQTAALNLASIRNQLFTAITRSKAWVRVLGIGNGMQELTKEFETLKKSNFELRFTYPTQEQREQLRIVHRDRTTEELKQIRSGQQFLRNLKALAKEIESGSLRLEELEIEDGTTEAMLMLISQLYESGFLRIEDLDEDKVEKLKEVLQKA